MRTSFHPVESARKRAADDPEAFDAAFGTGVYLLVNSDLFRPHFNELPNTLDTQEGAPVTEADFDGVLVRVPDEALAAGRMVLGRHEDNHLPLWNASVSARHVELWREGDELVARDLGSYNGTSLRGIPISTEEPQPLQHGDTLRLGSIAVGILFGPRLREWLLQGR